VNKSKSHRDLIEQAILQRRHQEKRESHYRRLRTLYQQRLWSGEVEEERQAHRLDEGVKKCEDNGGRTVWVDFLLLLDDDVSSGSVCWEGGGYLCQAAEKREEYQNQPMQCFTNAATKTPTAGRMRDMLWRGLVT
jgi:hypothetical protein